MLLIIDASQMAFPDLELVVKYFKGEDYDVMLTGLERTGHIIEPMAKIIDDVDGVALYKEDKLDALINCYMRLMTERDALPETTHIISNRGQDLAAAILMGATFTWGFDIT